MCMTASPLPQNSTLLLRHDLSLRLNLSSGLGRDIQVLVLLTRQNNLLIRTLCNKLPLANMLFRLSVLSVLLLLPLFVFVRTVIVVAGIVLALDHAVIVRAAFNLAVGSVPTSTLIRMLERAVWVLLAEGAERAFLLRLVRQLLRAGWVTAGTVAVLAGGAVAALDVHVDRIDHGFAGRDRGMVREGTIRLGAVEVEAADGARWIGASVGGTVGGL